MQHIKQHNNHSCVIASIAMLTDGVSYRSIKNYCRKNFRYNVTKKSGCFVEHSPLIEYLQSLGHNIVPLPPGVVGTLAELCNNSKAIIFLSTDTGGHALAWDGCRAFDPSLNQPCSENELYRQYPISSLNVGVICIKTPTYKRFANRFKLWYYNTCDVCKQTSKSILVMIKRSVVAE